MINRFANRRCPLAFFLIALLLLAGRNAGAGDFHVSPSGMPDGDGSAAAPWDLASALSHPPSVVPGDTIWLHQGVYRGTFVSRLAGTAAAPIVVRQAPGERAVIDGGCSGQPVLLVGGSFAWYWGFEILNSDPHRVTRERGSFPEIRRGIGVYTSQAPGDAVGSRFINLVVHDTAEGFGVWKEAEGAEVYGSLIYYNGWDAPDRGHGHGIYAQNDDGTMRFVDNVLFDQFSHGLHAYGSSSAFLNGFHVEGNIAFNNGRLSLGGNARNFLIGGGRVAESPVVVDNAAYYPFGTGGENNLGYAAGTSNLVATGNLLVGDLALSMIDEPTTSFTANTLIGAIRGFSPAGHPGNVYLPAAPPTGAEVIVRPNRYEPGRANVAIFNWGGSSHVPVDLSGVLSSGTPYEVRDAQNFFAPPVASGTYTGGTVPFPMELDSVARPIGSLPVQPSHTAPEFAAFVVLPAVAGISSCGDGVVDAGEACDDGGIIVGDGCSDTCASEALCEPVPATSCRHVVGPNKSSLLVTRQGGVRDTLTWRWIQGSATSLADFGDPSSGTRYELCVYDGTSTLVQRINVPAERSCGDPAWRSTPGGLKYKDATQLPDGKLSVSLKPGAQDGRAAIVVTGRGPFLDTMPLPAAAFPLRVQLRRSGGPCWEATFAGATQNSGARLRSTGG